MNKYLKYFLRTIAVLAGLFLLVTIGAYLYLSAHKKELTEKLRTEVAEKLNGEVQIGNIDLTIFKNFPSISVLLENVSIKDTAFGQHKHPFFSAEKVYAVVSISNLIKKESPLTGIVLEKGQLYVYTDTSGYTNAYLFSPKKDTSTVVKPKQKSSFEIEKIKLEGVRLVLNDERKNKLYDFEVFKLKAKFKTKESIINIKNDADILVHDLAFNTTRGSFLKETSFRGKFELVFDTAQKSLSFNNMDVALKDQPFNLSGKFIFGPQPTFTIAVKTESLDYNLGKSYLPHKLDSVLSMIKLDEKIDEVTAEVSGALNGGDPLVKVGWKITDNSLHSPFVELKNCSLTGSFINEIVPGLPRKDPNSRLHFKNLTGDFGKIRINSNNVFLDNLTDPLVKCDIKSTFQLEDLNELLGSNSIHLHAGKGSVDLTYSGPLKDNSNQNTAINGNITFSNGLLAYHPREMEVKNVSGNIVFKNTDVYVNDFKGNAVGNKIVMSGSGKNILALAKTSPGKVVLDWNIYSPSLNLNQFSPLLRKRGSTIAKSNKKTALGSTARQLDELVTQANFRLNVKADVLQYQKFAARNVKASLSLVNEDWFINNISLDHAGGSMNIKGALIEKSNKVYGANLTTSMQDVDVSKVMYAFENFGQNGITSENLKGKLTMDAVVRLDLDREAEKPSNVDGVLNFSIKNGALIQYEPLKKIQKVVFKKRNFDEVYFAELKDKIEVKDQNFTINRMEIQSTVLTLFVEGKYSMAGNNTDLSIQVPISNFKKRGEDYVPENIGTEAKAGASVFVRGRTGTDGKVAFKLDLFNKFKKENKEGDDETKDDRKERRRKRKEERANKGKETTTDTQQNKATGK